MASSRKNGKINPEAKNITFATWFRSRKLSAPVASIDNARFFDELQVYWRENYNVEVADEIRSLDFDSVCLAMQGVEEVLNRFPKAARFFKAFEADATLSDNVIMGTEFEGQIKFNSRIFSDKAWLKTRAKKDRESGFHPKNTGIREYGAHEAGHILVRAFIDKCGGDSGDWNDDTSAWRILIRAWGALGESVHIKETRCEISKYALKNASETIAEAVSDYTRNGDAAAKLSKEIWRMLGEELQLSDY